MATVIPITLTKDNLGQRHHELNTLVREAYDTQLHFESIKNLPEKSPVDRLFKIDLASKLRNIDYILQNIKDEDFLYVSRALKCTWLLDNEYQDIFCPEHLEGHLYPDMVTTAITKMKNWLYLHLKDPIRCKQFYCFYHHKNVDFAIKFLYRCNTEFILQETPNILDRLTPHHFKRLCEICPSVAKIYFEIMPGNAKVKSKVLKNYREYYNSLKVVLKLAPDIYFDITEKYFNRKCGRSMTAYIMKNHKDKFDRKVELYSSSLLHVETLAEYLSPDECKELVLKLARAAYINHWFSYKNVEPLIKRLNIDERSAFKKRIFVNKDVGEMVEEWPYNIPVLPIQDDFDSHIFNDPKYECYDSPDCDVYDCAGLYREEGFMECCLRSDRIIRKTLLDKLFDEFRFTSFSGTLFELRRRIRVESSLQNREYMLLVLISKSGGLSENIASLFELLAQHSNEPINFRAAIVRSLMKRAAVWRLPQNAWEHYIEFARGLGLDGKTPELECHEAIHAVVLRTLLNTGDCENNVIEGFLLHFSDFKEYSINIEEKRIICERLPKLILDVVQNETNVEKQTYYLGLLLDTMQSYKMNVETISLIPAVSALMKRDFSSAQSLLQRIFDLKIARRTLFYENFKLIQNDASYVNALRHDTSVLDVKKFVDLAEKGEHRFDNFLRKLTVYFSETLGMMECYLAEIRMRVFEKPDVKIAIARSLCILQGADLPFIRAINPNTKHRAKLSAAVHANMHAGRLKLDMTKMCLSAIGAKGCANKVLICPKTQIDDYVRDLLKWRRTVIIAIKLAERTIKEAEVFATAVKLKPVATLKAAIKYFRSKGDKLDSRVWEVIKCTLKEIDYSTDQRSYLRNLVCKVNYIPQKIKPEYCIILSSALKDNFPKEAMKILACIENDIPQIHEDVTNKILLEFLGNFNTDEIEEKLISLDFYFRFIVKYLMFSKTTSMQKARLEVIGEPFLNCLEKLIKSSKNIFMECFKKVLLNLQFNKILFDVTYVSPLPVIQRIVCWMHLHLPVEIHFTQYVHVHLTMIYFRAIRKSIAIKPEIFADEKLKMTDGVDVVGHIFGQYVVKEIKELSSRYFESVIEIYKSDFCDYFYTYFSYCDSHNRFIGAVLKGMIEVSEGAETKLAAYLFKKRNYSLDSKARMELLEELIKFENTEAKFFVHAYLRK